MILLVIGGTVFVGRHIVEAALRCGHRVTLFNRGEHNPGLFPEIRKIRGDRATADGLAALGTGSSEDAGTDYDAVVDTCGYVPRIVRLSANALATTARRYCSVSSISVYADTNTIGLSEDSPVATLADAATETVDGDTYGPLKALCESEVQAVFGDRSLIIRPGLIVGPHDPTDRFTYWPRRIAEGGHVLAPDRPELPTQFIDARDLAEWTVAALEADRAGVYNATGPDYPLTMGAVLATCVAESGSDAEIVWAPPEFLAEQGIAPWSDLPLSLPPDEMGGFNRVDNRKAVAAGLRFRPLRETVRDTLAWNRALRPGHEPKAGLTRARERAALDAWARRSGVGG